MGYVNAGSVLTIQKEGFLKDGYTHSLNPYEGCSFGSALCGKYCYAAKSYRRKPKGVKEWKLYNVKQNAAKVYRKEYKTIKLGRNPRPLKVYMASVTDPYLPQEKKEKITRSILEAMIELPPDSLVIQTHNTLIERDIDVIETLSQQCEVYVNITIETDYERLPGFPIHASSPAKRIEVMKRFTDRGLHTRATLSPLLPIQNLPQFAENLNNSCTDLIIDHYLLGDGSKHGARTRKTELPALLTANGFDEWNHLDKFYEVREYLYAVLGEKRVLTSQEGFNFI